ncbi:hypothetical protein AGMMS49944_00990 [Spirochaetia bacterium]|nr:hypothetical protein AGMMS49944_00990 [Spirochaetia bacterium]
MPEITRIPKNSNDDEWILWGENFVPKAAANAARDGIPHAWAAALIAAFTVYKAGHISVAGPDSTPVLVAEKNADRAAFAAAARTIVNFLQASTITDAQRVDYGIHVRDKTCSKSPAIFSHVVLELSHTQSGFLHIRAHDQYDETVVMLPTADYGEVRMTIRNRGEAVKVYTETFHTARFDLNIGKENLGSEVTVEGRWRNTNDKIAPWGPAVTVVLS